MLLAQIADSSSKGIDRLVDAATQGNNFWWLMLFGMIVVTTAISRTTSAVKAASREKMFRKRITRGAPAIGAIALLANVRMQRSVNHKVPGPLAASGR